MTRDLADFKTRLKPHLKRLDAMSVLRANGGVRPLRLAARAALLKNIHCELRGISDSDRTSVV